MQIITSTVRDAGTRAERLALTPAASTAVFFWETDTKQSWFWDTVNWICLSISGAALATLATLLAGEDQTNDLIKVEQRYDYRHIATAATTAVKASPGFLHSVTVNTTAAGAITIYDSLAASGDVIAILKASVVENTFIFDVNCDIGITIVTAAASDITVNYR